jgi:nucleotide-binding universal stress UspA family protein
MGKSGLTPWRKTLLGSTTSAVIRETHVPVLTVQRTTTNIAVKRILFPTAFSPSEKLALALAVEFARTFDAVLVLLNVIEVHKSYGAVKGGFMGRLRASAGKQLRNFAEVLESQKAKGLTLLEKVTVSSRAWSGIVNFARDQDIDLIVMSTRARKGVAKFFLGSVAENVIREAPCPVIAVPPSLHSPGAVLKNVGAFGDRRVRDIA